MSLISEIDEYGFKRSEEEKTFLSENSEHFSKITKRQIEWNNFETSYRNSLLFRNFTLKRYIRKGMEIDLFSPQNCESFAKMTLITFGNLICVLSD